MRLWTLMGRLKTRNNRRLGPDWGTIQNKGYSLSHWQIFRLTCTVHRLKQAQSTYIYGVPPEQCLASSELLTPHSTLHSLTL